MAYRIKGRVVILTPTQTFASKSGNPYQSRFMVIIAIRYDQYTGQPTEDPDNTPKFTFFGRQCEQLDNIKIGDIVTVSFDIQGRAFDKDGQRDYFTEIRPFRVDIETQQAAPSQYPPQQGLGQGFSQSPVVEAIQNTFPNAEVVKQGVNDDDLPF